MVNNDINNLRQEIDQIDNQLLDLLNRRMNYAISIGQIKKSNKLPVTQTNREEEIIKRLENLNKGPLTRSDIEKIFKLLFEISKSLQ